MRAAKEDGGGMSEYIISIRDEADPDGWHRLTKPAEPIVRCRDCTHFRENLKFGDSYTWCAESAVSGRLTPPDGYCWRGERREA